MSLLEARELNFHAPEAPVMRYGPPKRTGSPQGLLAGGPAVNQLQEPKGSLEAGRGAGQAETEGGAAMPRKNRGCEGL